MAKQGRKTARGPRVRKGTWRQRRAQAKRDLAKRPKIAGVFKLLGQSLSLFKRGWRQIIVLVITLVLLSLAASIYSSIQYDFSDYHDNLDNPAQLKHFRPALSAFRYLFESPLYNTSSGFVLHVVFTILMSLALIWTLRQLAAKKSFKMTDMFFYSMTPLVQFCLVIVALIIEAIPAAIGTAALTNVLNNNGEAWGIVLFSIVFVLTVLMSFYLIIGSIFALYIVTLPDITPWSALRSAHGLVRFRRFSVFWRLAWVVILFGLLMAIMTIPFIVYYQPLIAGFFMASFVIVFFLGHSYLYNLYRSLIA